MALSRRTGARFQASIWPGFVDAMTGLLLVLMFVLTMFMIVQFVLSEQISGQETELDQLAGEVAALAEALGLEQDETNALQAELGTTNTSLDAARDEVSQQAALIASLSAERDSQTDQLAAAATQITGFEARVAALLAERDTALGTVADLEDAQTALLSEQEALNLALARSRGEVDAQAEAARLAAARREALEALVVDLRQRNADAATQVQVLTGDLNAAQAALSDEEAAKLLEAAAAEALRERLQNADAELTAMTLALEAQRKDAEDTLTLLAAARSAQSDLDQELVAALLNLESVQQAAKTGADAQEQLGQLQAENAGLEVQLKAVLAQLDTTQTEAQAQVGQLQAEYANLENQLNAALAQLDTSQTEAQAQLIQLSAEKADLETRLTAVSAELDAIQTEATTDRDALRAQLAEALAAKLAAQVLVDDTSTDAERRAALLAQAQKALAQEEAASAESQRQTELLNQQVAALRGQLGEIQALLDDAVARDAVAQVQLQSLGSELNTALARVAAEERRRAELETAERKRLEIEAARLQEETKDLEQYRSEFFGRLRDVLGRQEGVRIEGDRFVFSSEVLFPPGEVVLSEDGKREVAKVANILSSVASDIPPEIDWVVRVDGHTDDTPLSGFGEFADNWELSQARALSVVKYMSSALGIAPNRLAANGFGQYQPVAFGDSDEARAQNRRIELKFTEK